MNCPKVFDGRLTHRRRSTLAVAATCLALLAMGGALPRSALAQAGGAYKEMPTQVRGWIKAIHSSQASAIKQQLLGNENFDAASFEAFFHDILFPQFTLVNENVFIDKEVPPNPQEHHTSRLPKMREEFTKQFVGAARQNKIQPAYDFLNKLTIDTMTQIALDNYHPLARYNAAMMLSNVTDFASGKPAKEALPALVRCLDSIDVVKLAALTGIARQIESGNTDDQRRKLQDALIKIVLDAKPAPGDTADGHNWVRRKAMETLVTMADPGANQAVLKAYVAVIKDSKSPIPLACAAAKSLGSFNLRGAAGIDPRAVAISIAVVGMNAYKAELARAEDLAAAAPIPVAAKGNGFLPGAGPQGAQGRGVQAAPVDVQYISVALLQSQLGALQVAIKGVGTTGGLVAAAGAQDAATVAKVDKGLADLLSACDPADKNYEHLKAMLDKASKGLSEVASGAGGAVAPDAKGGAGDQFDNIPSKPAAGKTGR